jgi:RNA polymerase sigma factor (sigma-70 family)
VEIDPADLVRNNLSFVVWIARTYRHRGVAFDELVAQGNLGLLEAARRFDPTRGTKFTTYAAWWIRKSILTALAAAKGGSARTLSLDDPLADRPNEPRSAGIADRGAIDPQAALLEREAARLVRAAVVGLPQLDRTVLEHRFGLEDRPVLSLRETGAALGLCGERVRQIERRSLDHLRRALRRTPHHLRPTDRPMRSAVSRSNFTTSASCGFR